MPENILKMILYLAQFFDTIFEDQQASLGPICNIFLQYGGLKNLQNKKVTIRETGKKQFISRLNELATFKANNMYAYILLLKYIQIFVYRCAKQSTQ